jgi:hypothetical protein
MPRTFGTANAPQYATAPAVGPAGNLYYNTTLARLFVSDGVTWDGVDAYNTTEGWMTASYKAYIGTAASFMFDDNNVMVSSIPKGTRTRITYGGTDYYGVVANCVNGAPLIAANPLTGISLDATTDFFTKTAHGLANGDCIWFLPSWNPVGVNALVPFYVLNVTASTFQLASSPTAAFTNFGTSAAEVRIATGTRVDLAPNADVALARAANVAITQYSYAMSPPGYPGWWNYTTAQAINPLTYTGYSVIPTAPVYLFRIDGNLCTYVLKDTGTGTSNSTAMTMTLPVACSATPASAFYSAPGRATDNVVALTTPALLHIPAGNTVVNVYKDYSAAAWTASGGKRLMSATIQYPI